MPATNPTPETHFWCERITSRSLTATNSDIDKIERRSARTPAEAIRRTRLTVRALSWAEAAAVGGPCGFPLGHHRARLEWTVHPYYAFHTPETRQLPLVPR
ncbi:hypothetical protein [Streptomyces niveus]|uniref:hypothetical protein n=1 Tax=Streptomyces niveus TaxID=193462 RepID=UPI0035DC611D